LGLSLGIDPVPLKTCNFSCVYCQLGRSPRLATKRKAYSSLSDIGAEVASVLGRHEHGAIDWITFVGSGETTLSTRLGSMIRFVRSITDLPVAVITNGSLLHLPRVRGELLSANAVLPSLDAGTESLYRRINRPRRELSFERHVEGLVEFRSIFRGNLWVEVMLIGGLNDTEEALRDIAAVLEMVKPDEIHLATPTRPPAEPWVVPPGAEGLGRAVSILGRVAKVLEPVSVGGAPSADGDLAEAVLRIVQRHPLHDAEIENLLTHWIRDRVDEAMATLAGTGEIQFVERFGKRFWCAAELDFPKNRPPDDRSATFQVSQSDIKRMSV
jgi:wyosine [tRNA(Phe)-imidazoG37] synthetase (radical SAM superfamily)